MGGTGSKPEGENEPDMAQVAKDKKQFDKIVKNDAAFSALEAFEESFLKNVVPEDTSKEIKDLEDLFQKLNKEIDKDFDNFREEILTQQAESLKRINLNSEQIDQILKLSNEIIKLLGNKGSSLILPVKDKDGKVSSVLTSSKLSEPIESRAKKEEYLKEIGVTEKEIYEFYKNKKTLEDYLNSK